MLKALVKTNCWRTAPWPYLEHTNKSFSNFEFHGLLHGQDIFLFIASLNNLDKVTTGKNFNDLLHGFPFSIAEPRVPWKHDGERCRLDDNLQNHRSLHGGDKYLDPCAASHSRGFWASSASGLHNRDARDSRRIRSGNRPCTTC